MYCLRKSLNFEAAHFLPNHDGKCRNLHGHRWEIVIEIKSSMLDNQGMVFDFMRIGRIVRDEYDHTCLNDKVDVPTAENLAKIIWDRIILYLDKEMHKGLTVTVIETPGSEVSYSRELTWGDE